MNNFDLSHQYTNPRPSISVHYIPNTQYKFSSADCPSTHNPIQTILIATMTLTAAVLHLCHKVCWNF